MENCHAQVIDQERKGLRDSPSSRTCAWTPRPHSRYLVVITLAVGLVVVFANAKAAQTNTAGGKFTVSKRSCTEPCRPGGAGTVTRHRQGSGLCEQVQGLPVHFVNTAEAITAYVCADLATTTYGGTSSRSWSSPTPKLRRRTRQEASSQFQRGHAQHRAVQVAPAL